MFGMLYRAPWRAFSKFTAFYSAFPSPSSRGMLGASACLFGLQRGKLSMLEAGPAIMNAILLAL